MSHINDMCRHDSDVSLSHSLEDMSHYVKDCRYFCVKWPPKWRIHWHDVFGNTFSGIYASTLKALRLLVSEIDVLL